MVYVRVSHFLSLVQARQTHLVPDKGVELEDDWPGVPHANPVAVPPSGQCLWRPIVNLHTLQLPGALQATIVSCAAGI